MADKKIICPLMGGLPCIEDGAPRRDTSGKVVLDGNGEPEMVACRFWVYVQGKHPQTGEDTHTGDCAFAWMPVLQIENSRVGRQVGAAVESLRNEGVTTGQQITGALMQVAGEAAQTRLLK